jgi:hypothetical protein
MKQKDILLVVVVGVVSVILALVVSSMLFGSPDQKQQKAEVVDKITADFSTPDERYFNANSIDPTQSITIGDNSNQTPFKQTQQ